MVPENAQIRSSSLQTVLELSDRKATKPQGAKLQTTKMRWGNAGGKLSQLLKGVAQGQELDAITISNKPLPCGTQCWLGIPDAYTQ